MKYRRMGKHGIKLSEISIGTMYHGSYIKKDAALACLNEAVNQGINFIDCADRYGIDDSELPMNQRTRTEKILGEFLKDQYRDESLKLMGGLMSTFMRMIIMMEVTVLLKLI